MRQSQFFARTRREAPKDEAALNAQLLIKAGFIDKLAAGVYSYLPLGLRVLKKIENVVREEMLAMGGQEILMPVIHPKSLWDETGRWDKMDEILYKIKDREGREFLLGPTHEEVIVDIVRKHQFSYSDLPFFLFQIQTKFRDEPRAKSGLLRNKEFFMKDLYSFHATDDDRADYYEKMKEAYLKIFSRLGIEAKITEASGGDFSENYSHEFQVLTPAGEDTIFFCPDCDFAQNKEIAKTGEGDPCPRCGCKIQSGKSIEVGNIFDLKDKFSLKLGAFFIDKDGNKKPLIMGCYGLGLGRAMGAIAEVNHDDKGIVWPEEAAPFETHLLKISGSRKNDVLEKAGEKIYAELRAKGIEVLYDDRGESAGVKFADADLIGCPYRIVVSEKTLEQKSVEVKDRRSGEVKMVKIDNLMEIFG